MESSTSFHRFRLTVEPKKTENLLVKEYRPITNSYQLSNISEDLIKFFLSQKMISPEIEQALRKVMAQRATVAVIDGEVASRNSKISGISEDPQRVRENMKALKGSAEEKALLQRYTRQLDSQEDRLNTLTKEISDLSEKQTQARNQLDQIVQQIGLDESF